MAAFAGPLAANAMAAEPQAADEAAERPPQTVESVVEQQAAMEYRCEASCRTPAWKRPLSCPSWAWSFTRARAAAAGFQNAGNGFGRDRTDIFEARGNAQTLEEKVVREFKAELEGIERKLQSQEDIFVNRSLAVCECFFAVRFEDHSDVLEKKLSARNSRSRLT